MQDRAKELIEAALKASRIGFKSVWVGRSGSILATFYSLEAARRAAILFGDFASNLQIADGCYDDHDGGYTKVCRVSGLMSA